MNMQTNMNNMNALNSYTYTHNYNVLSNKTGETEIDTCNSSSKDTCPLLSICHTKSLIYQAYTDCHITGYKQKLFSGSCETAIKERFRSHKKSFNHIKRNKKEVWEIKEHNGTPKIILKGQNMPIFQSIQ